MIIGIIIGIIMCVLLFVAFGIGVKIGAKAEKEETELKLGATIDEVIRNLHKHE